MKKKTCGLKLKLVTIASILCFLYLCISYTLVSSSKVYVNTSSSSNSNSNNSNIVNGINMNEMMKVQQKGSNNAIKTDFSPTKLSFPKHGDMKEIIKEQMESSLESLPSPPWPQLDHRTAQALASGLILGLENSTEFNFNHTIGKSIALFYVNYPNMSIY